jgi:peptide-methionine (S)-S-oxide reductase
MAADIPDNTRGRTAMATFAGGCFWCMQPPFDAEPGVFKTIVGYTGGNGENPTYEEVTAGSTGHAESLRIDFDPAVVNYERLLEIFWKNIDPLDGQGQFCDRGLQYRSAIFYHDNEQKELAEASKERLVENGSLSGEVFTEIVPASTFYPAEEYHQDYYKKNPLRYKFYRYNCGRDRRLKQLWGSP